VGAQYGKDVFARICWANGQIETPTKMFAELGITWDEINEGFIELRRKWPTSAWTLNYHCRLAVAARERVAAAQLFQEIGEDIYDGAWSSPEYLEKSRRWALGSTAAQKTTTRTPRRAATSPQDRSLPAVEDEFPNLGSVLPQKKPTATPKSTSPLPATEKTLPQVVPKIESEAFTPPPITIPK
jgi:hypothetical protein